MTRKKRGLINALHDALYIFVEESKLAFKDEGVLIFFFLVPLLYPVLYSWIYTNESVKDVPAVIIDNSHTSLSREFIRKLDATQGIKVFCYANNMEEAKEMIRLQKCRGIITIPADFSDDIQNNRQTHVGLYADMSGILYYKGLMISLTDVSLSMGSEILVKKLGNYTDREDALTQAPMKTEYIAMFNPQEGYGSYLLPGVLVLIIQQTLLLGIGLSAGTTRENNRYQLLIPIEKHYNGIFRIIFGKGMSYFLIYAAVSAYITLAIPHMFHFIQIGLPRDLIGLLIPYLLACIFFAMTISCLIRYRENVILIIVFSSVPLLMLSGILWPSSSLAGPWKAISWLFPSTFGINGFVKINSMGATLNDIITEYRALWIQVAAYFLIDCFVYYRQIQMSKRMHISRIEEIRRENRAEWENNAKALINN